MLKKRHSSVSRRRRRKRKNDSIACNGRLRLLDYSFCALLSMYSYSEHVCQRQNVTRIRKKMTSLEMNLHSICHWQWEKVWWRQTRTGSSLLFMTVPVLTFRWQLDDAERIACSGYTDIPGLRYIWEECSLALQQTSILRQVKRKRSSSLRLSVDLFFLG